MNAPGRVDLESPGPGLPAFLLARYDEDDAVAQATRKNEQFVYGTDRLFATHNDAIVSMAPHRAVDEIAAKRRLVKFAEDLWATEPSNHPVARINRQATYILRLLALPFAAHPDYDENWRP